MENLHNWLNPAKPGIPKTLNEIKEKMKELKVEIKEKNGLVLFNYEDDAPRTDPLVCGCRGTIWRFENEWVCVRSAFDRFFNLGEEGAPSLPDFSNIQLLEKMDGTLAILYHDPVEQKWTWGTRNTFDLSVISVAGGRSMKSVLDKVPLGDFMRTADTSKSYMFELCTPYSTVVVFHPESKLVFLGMRSNTFPYPEFDDIPSSVQSPQKFSFPNIEECRSYIEANGGKDFEGMVLKFGPTEAPSRLKLKSKTFVALARTSNPTSPPEEQIIMSILSNDLPELLAYFPSWTDRSKKMEEVYKNFSDKVQMIEDELNKLPSTSTKKDQADVIKRSVCPEYHFQKRKFPKLADYLKELAKKGPVRVLDLIGYEV